MSSFAEALAFGEEGEHAVARKLLEGGATVAPLYQYRLHDRAPVALYMVEGDLDQVVLPDLSCWSKTGKAYVAEVKRKNRWVRWDGQLETSFGQRLFKHYRLFRNRTGHPLWCFFVHQTRTPTGVYAQRLSVLERHVRLWDGRDPQGRRREEPMALFPKRALRRVWDLADLDLRVAS